MMISDGKVYLKKARKVPSPWFVAKETTLILPFRVPRTGAVPVKNHFNLSDLFCGSTSTKKVIIPKIIIVAIKVIPFPSCSLDLVISPVDRKSISFAAPPPNKLTIILTKSFFKFLIKRLFIF